MTGDRFTSFADRTLDHSATSPNRRAVVCDGLSLTYREASSKALACAGRIQALGFKPDGAYRIGLLGLNSLDFTVVVLACQCAGVPVVPLPVLVTPDAQSRMLADARVTLLFHDSDYTQQARAAVDLLGESSRVTLVSIGPASPSTAGTSGMLDDWIGGTSTCFTTPKLGSDWTSDIVYSSGTTGNPKGIVQSYGARQAQCVSLATLGATDGFGFLQSTGLYSNFGLSGFFLALWWGGTCFIMRKFSGDATVDILANEAVSMAWFAPATLIRTMASPEFNALLRGRSCIKLCAGAPLSGAQKRQVLDAWPGPFYDLYGQAETGTLTLHAMHAAPPSKLGSVGKALPTVSLRIINDAGDVVRGDEEGEIVGHSTTLMSGYHERNEASSSMRWTDELGRVYIRTGDVGKIDADDYLWLCDRKRDMIISGGSNIYPADIERVLAAHPAVFEAAVIGCASVRWGESPVAFVTLREGAEAQEEESLRTWVNSRLGAIQRVALIKILPELPNGTMGKVLKRELRDRFAQEIGSLP